MVCLCLWDRRCSWVGARIVVEFQQSSSSVPGIQSSSAVWYTYSDTYSLARSRRASPLTPSRYYISRVYFASIVDFQLHTMPGNYITFYTGIVSSILSYASPGVTNRLLSVFPTR